MTGMSSTKATGRENAAGWNTTTAGTTSANGITAIAVGTTGSTTGTIGAEVTTKTIGIATTKSIQDSPEAYVVVMAARKFTLPAIVGS